MSEGGPEVPDGIFDMIASVSAFLDTGRVASRGLMQDPCPTCLGVGRMTCDRCKGTKTVQNTPARLISPSKRVKLRFLRREGEMEKCFECGPLCKYDFDLNSEDINDDIDASIIRQNFAAALQGRRVPLQFPCTAGTVVCKTCKGSKVIKRPVPNFARLFGLTPTLFEEYSARDGVQTYKDSNRALFKPRNVQAYAEFREHPRQPTWRETFTPVIRVHAILCNEIQKNKKDLTKVNTDLCVSPWRFRLPNLDGSNVAPANKKPVGHELAFP